MAELIWGLEEDRTYEFGVSRGVLYPTDGKGVAWNGLISVAEQSVGGDRTPLHFDGIKYYDEYTWRDFQATVDAYSAPREFYECLGTIQSAQGLMLTRQPRTRFGMSYRTEMNDSHYRIHLIYNAMAKPSVASANTLNSSPSPRVNSWTIDAVPNLEESLYPTSHLILDSRKTPRGMLTLLEDEMYGRSGEDPYLPNKDTLIHYLGNVITEPLSEPI